MQPLNRLRLVPVLFVSALILACGTRESRETPSSNVKSVVEPSDTLSGPTVSLEVFPVFLSEGRPYVLVPRDTQSWQFPLQNSGHAHDLVRCTLVSNTLEPEVIHSTSWRQNREKLLITYLVVVHNPEKIPKGFNALPAVQSGLVRGEATAPPQNIPTQAVIHHAFQHLAWLYQTDAIIRDTLSESWREVLRPFQPQPFKSFESSPGKM